MPSLFRIPSALIAVTLLSGVLFIPQASPAAPQVKHTTTHVAKKKVVPSHSPAKPGVKKTTSTPPAASFNPNAFIPYYNQARQFYQADHYAQAEKPLKQAYLLAEQVLQKKPSELQRKNVAIISQLVGLNAFQLKKYKESEVFLKKALNFNELPQYQAEHQDAILTALLIMGQMAMYDARYTEAQNYYQRALPLQETKLGAEAAQTKQTRRILEDIARIDYGPDYLNAMGQKITHWTHPEQPIAIYIEDGSQLPGWKPENKQLVYNAYAEWQQALGSQVQFIFVDDPLAADTVVSWMERPKQGDLEEESTHQKELRNGECQTQVLENTLAKDNIVVALNNTEGKAYAANSINNTLLHEIAHSIGLLGGHSTNPSDVLFPNNGYEDGRQKHLTQRDIQTALKLYSYPATVTNPAGIHLVTYQQYMELLMQGSKAYNQQDFSTAANLLRSALSLYNQESNTRFLYGVSQYQLKNYAEALPYLMSASNMPQGKYRDEALKMTGYTLIKLGEADDRSGASYNAEQKYRRAYEVLSQGLQAMPVKPENQKAIRDELSWINQRLALPSNTTIQWVTAAPTQEQNPANATEPKNKKGWFSGFANSFSEYFMPAPVAY